VGSRLHETATVAAVVPQNSLRLIFGPSIFKCHLSGKSIPNTKYIHIFSYIIFFGEKLHIIVMFLVAGCPNIITGNLN